MRNLTRFEAQVVRSLLAAEDQGERQRIEASGVPRRSFERARRRAYVEGWVVDRYIPHPIAANVGFASIVIARPFAEHIRSIESQWAAQGTGSVLVWGWTDTLVGVFLGNETPLPLRTPAEVPGVFRSLYAVNINLRREAVSVYFDFEGAWVRAIGSVGTTGYPHSFPSTASSGQPPSSYRKRSRIEELVAKSMRSFPTGPLRTSTFYLPRSDQRLLAEGAVDRRTFLEPRALLTLNRSTAHNLAFVTGTLIDGGQQKLARRLASIGILPFLFAADDSRVIMGTLSRSPGPSDLARPRPAVLKNLQEFLTQIEIWREPIDGMNQVVNHRYDRLF